MLLKVARKTAADANLDDMVVECIKDINSDEELSEGEDDPALLVCNRMPAVIKELSIAKNY